MEKDTQPVSTKPASEVAFATVCPYAKKCGGCDYQGVPYAEQLKKKQKDVRKLLEPFKKPEPILEAAHPLHYRNKVHGIFGRDKKGNIFTGIYEEKSHRIVPVEDCGIEDATASAILKTLCELVKSFKIRVYDEDRGTGFLRHALIRVGRNTKEVMVVLVVTDPIFPSKNNFTKELTKGVFYGMVDDGMLNNANYGANLTTPPTDATASIEDAQWYTVADDSTSVGPGDDSTTVNPVLTGKRAVDSQKPRLYFDSKEQAVFVRYKKNGREYRYRVSGTRNR